MKHMLGGNMGKILDPTSKQMAFLSLKRRIAQTTQDKSLHASVRHFQANDGKRAERCFKLLRMQKGK